MANDSDAVEDDGDENAGEDGSDNDTKEAETDAATQIQSAAKAEVAEKKAEKAEEEREESEAATTIQSAARMHIAQQEVQDKRESQEQQEEESVGVDEPSEVRIYLACTFIFPYRYYGDTPLHNRSCVFDRMKMMKSQERRMNPKARPRQRKLRLALKLRKVTLTRTS